MGKLIIFPKRQKTVAEIADEALAEMGYTFTEKPAAKSTTSVLKASVCQGCGCKLDGKVETMRPGCTCKCHKDGVR